MKLLSRVVWSEGMYLGPHHFQAQARHFEDSIRFISSCFWFAPYGLAGFELDSDAVSSGMVSLLHARGIFPDGLPFNLPESDILPEPRSIADLFPPTSDGVIVKLAIPADRPAGMNYFVPEEGTGAVSDGGARYVAEGRLLHDENTGTDERRVRLGRKNLRIIFDTEQAGDLVTLPLARIVRDGSGHFAFDADFIPPLLDIGASMPLMLLLRRLTDILEQTSGSLKSGGLNDAASTRQIAGLWLLHSVNAALGPLQHLAVARRGHPEKLFQELSRLAGALCTFGLDSNARDLPLYNHDNLSGCFQQLDRHIRAHLEIIVPTNCISIPLTSAEKYFYDGEIGDTRALQRSRWVLAINADMGEAELITRVPQLIKICSPPFVRELVKRALPGLELTHMSVPPAAISARPETQYFGVSRIGPCWDHMVKTRTVGVYVPGEFPNVTVEILVVLDQ